MKSKPARKPSKATKPAKSSKVTKPVPPSRVKAAPREQPVIPATEKCERCNGQGCIPVLCPKCHGHPSLTHEACKKCKGIGYVDATCKICKGTGEAPEEELEAT
jgi:hypothetical protein